MDFLNETPKHRFAQRSTIRFSLRRMRRYAENFLEFHCICCGNEAILRDRKMETMRDVQAAGGEWACGTCGHSAGLIGG